MNFCDTVKAMRAAAAHQARVKFTRIAKDLFELSFTDENAETLQKDALKSENEKSADKQKRRRHKSTKNANELSVRQSQFITHRKCSISSDQDNQSSSSFKRCKCHDYDELHFY